MKKYYINKVQSKKTTTGWGWVVLKQQDFAPTVIRICETESEASELCEKLNNPQYVVVHMYDGQVIDVFGTYSKSEANKISKDKFETIYARFRAEDDFNSCPDAFIVKRLK